LPMLGHAFEPLREYRLMPASRWREKQG